MSTQTVLRAAPMQGVEISGDQAVCPAAGGGFALDAEQLAQSDLRYLTFCLEVMEEHSMAFELRAYARDEREPRVNVRFGAMPRFPAAITLDLEWLSGGTLFPGHRVGQLMVVCHGSRIARRDIERAELVSVTCHHPVRVRLWNIALSDAPALPLPLPSEPLIDEMGQYKPKEWPGKMKDAAQMIDGILRQASDKGAYPYDDWTRYGGSARRRLTEGTGFFSRVKQNGRWYLTDPDGYAFFSTGVDCVNVRADARVDGLESLMEGLPCAQDADARLLVERSFGVVPRGPAKMYSYHGANLRRAFGEDWYAAWCDLAVRQLKNHGLNTVGNWSDPDLFGLMPYVAELPYFPKTKHAIFRDFPDVFSPEYEADARECAQVLAPYKDDPMMIGYFLRNEPAWAFVNNLILADEVLRDAENTCTKRALIKWLETCYVDVARLNQAWGLSLTAFSDLERPMESASACSEQAKDDLRAFSGQMVRRYTAIPAASCRAVDPNHMILGMRWAWISDPTLIAGWDVFDVFSINCYAVDPTDMLDRVRALGVDLPVMIGEYHFGALDAGLTATGRRGVTSQKERGIAYRYYTERAAAHPSCVGCHYFQYADQFALGRFDGENYNIGLFDVCMQPYADMLSAVRDCGAVIYDVADGVRPPFDQEPDTIPMIAY